MKSPEPNESCDAGATNVKRAGRKASESWSDSCVCQVDFLQSYEKGEENVIQVLPFKCQLSSSLRTGAESGLLSVASVCEWLLVSFDLISILTWGAHLDIWNRHAQRHTCFLTHSVQRPQFFLRRHKSIVYENSRNAGCYDFRSKIASLHWLLHKDLLH